jgi:xanthine dehydrogenase accessory factor
MKEVFENALEELSSNNEFVVASVVKTSGSTPQKPGSKLLVRKDGTTVGTLGGGCVEGDIWFAAKEILVNGDNAKYQDYILNEDLAASDGLVCGGTMYFLIDPYRSESSDLNKQILSEVTKAYSGEFSMVLATIVNSADESKIGQKIIIKESGELIGNLSDEKLITRIVQEAPKLISFGSSIHIEEESTQLFVEGITTEPAVLVAGGGHVGKAIAPIASNSGFKVWIVDDREDFANEERFPEAEKIVNGNFEKAFDELPIRKNTFIVIATRGHNFDDVVLENALKTEAKYVALLGSKRKAILIYESLLRKGIPEERLKEVRSPAGLSIGARTPNEIAVSIVAEMIGFRNSASSEPMKLNEKLFKKIVANSKN